MVDRSFRRVALGCLTLPLLLLIVGGLVWIFERNGMSVAANVCYAVVAALWPIPTALPALLDLDPNGRRPDREATIRATASYLALAYVGLILPIALTLLIFAGRTFGGLVLLCVGAVWTIVAFVVSLKFDDDPYRGGWAP